MNKDTFCVVPWVASKIRPDGYQDGCCVMVHQVPFVEEHLGMHEIRNCDYLKTVRKELMNGIQHWNCKQCWDKEKRGLVSRRTIRNKRYSDLIDLIQEHTNPDGSINYDKIPIVEVDVRFGNICNARCVICSYHNSSMFGGEVYNWMENSPYLRDLRNDFVDLRHMSILGGEPFISNYHWDFIDLLIKHDHAKNLIIWYSTNGSVADEKYIDKLKHFKYVQVGLSIDGIEDTFEKIRVPLKWDKISNNLIKLNKIVAGTNVHLRMNPTICTLNIYEIHKLFEWKIKNNLDNFEPDFNTNILYQPPQFSIIDNPDIDYERVKALYTPFIDEPGGQFLRNILQYIKRRDDD